MLASTKNDNEKVVSARWPTPPILKCYLVSVSNEKSIFQVGPISRIQFSRRRSRPSSGYNLFIIMAGGHFAINITAWLIY